MKNILLLDRLPTRVNLFKKGLQLTNAGCPLCLEGIKTGQHLLGTCKIVREV